MESSVPIPSGSESLPVISNSDEIEKKVWDVLQQIPGLNVGYGSVRLIIYIGKGNREESWKSAAGVAKGLVQTAAIAGTVFVAPFVTPIAAGALTGVVSESINGVAHLIIFIIEHPEDLIGKDNTDQKEKRIYNEIKEIPAIGPVYSAARTPVYILKGNAEEAKISGINSIVSSANTATTCGAGMLTMLDAKTQNLIQKLSKSIIQVVSRKVLEKVTAKEITLEQGLEIVENVEAKCGTLVNADVELCCNDPEGLMSKVDSTFRDISDTDPVPEELIAENNTFDVSNNSEIQKQRKVQQRTIRNAFDRLLALCFRHTKASSPQTEVNDPVSGNLNSGNDLLNELNSITKDEFNMEPEPIIIVI